MNEQLTLNPNIRLVVNGGSTVLDAATIPVEWHLSDKLIEKKPQYVVICDHETTLSYLKNEGKTYFGNRYFCKVTELAKYLQLFTSGTHHLVVMVFCGSSAERDAQSYLKKGRNGRTWDEPIWHTDLQDQRYDREVTFFEFEVPKELFAEKPETGFSALIWKWVNGWYDKKPIDECEYRKRKIYAFTIKPPLFLILWTIVSILGTLYTTLGSFFLLFFGYRPVSPWKNIGYALTINYDEFDTNLVYHQSRRGWQWRLWKGKDDKNGPTYIPKAFVPWIFCIWTPLTAKIGYSIVYTLINHPPSVSLPSSSIFLTILTILLVIAFSYLLVTRIIKYVFNPQRTEKRREKARDKRWEKEEKKEQKEAQLKKEGEQRISNFLKANASISSVPAKVDMQRIIPVVDTVTRFKFRFWGAKVKICKPYAHN